MTNFKSLFLVLVPLYGFSFILSLSSSYTFTIWLGVEINLITFIGLLNLGKSGSLESGSMKYFLSQALGSIILIMALMLQVSAYTPPYAASMIFAGSILLKLGLFPFHWWFLSFMMTSNFGEVWLVSVPQKILPFWLFAVMKPVMFIMFFSSLLGVMISVFGGLKANRLALLLGYSSLMNGSWFLLFLKDLNIFCLIFLLYGLSLGLLLLFMSSNTSSFNGIGVKQSWGGAVSQGLLFLNLGGLPPFVNMWGKFYLGTELVMSGSLFLLSIFILSAAAFLFAYLSASIWGMSLLGTSKKNWAMQTNLSSPSLLLLASSVMFCL